MAARCGASRSPSRDSSGIVAIVRAVTNSTTLAVFGASRPSPVATETITKANSPPGPSSRPVRRPFAQLNPKTRVSGAMISTFSSTTPPAAPKTSKGSAPAVRMSRLMPTEIRNTPTKRPLNGSIVTSTWRRYSVPASSSPPISAPRAIERPAAAAARPVAITTSRHAATNSSGLRVRATLRNSGRSTRRPRATIAPIASSACPTARPKPAALPAWLVGPSAARTSSTGTTARS